MVGPPSSGNFLPVRSRRELPVARETLALRRSARARAFNDKVRSSSGNSCSFSPRSDSSGGGHPETTSMRGEGPCSRCSSRASSKAMRAPMLCPNSAKDTHEQVTIEDGLVFATTGDSSSNFSAFDAQTGQRRWTRHARQRAVCTRYGPRNIVAVRPGSAAHSPRLQLRSPALDCRLGSGRLNARGGPGPWPSRGGSRRRRFRRRSESDDVPAVSQNDQRGRYDHRPGRFDCFGADRVLLVD